MRTDVFLLKMLKVKTNLGKKYLDIWFVFKMVFLSEANVRRCTINLNWQIYLNNNENNQARCLNI